MSRRSKISWAIALFAIALIALFWWDYILLVVVGTSVEIVAGHPSKQDRADALEVCQAIDSHHNFTRSLAALPGRSPVFCNPGSRSLITVPIKVRIYYVTSRDDQDKLIRELERLRKTKNLKPIKVNFYAEENWIPYGPARSTEDGPWQGGRRGPEHPIREVTIK